MSALSSVPRLRLILLLVGLVAVVTLLLVGLKREQIRNAKADEMFSRVQEVEAALSSLPHDFTSVAITPVPIKNLARVTGQVDSAEALSHLRTALDESGLRYTISGVQVRADR